MDTENSVMKASGEGGKGWVEVGKEGEMGDICNSVNSKKTKQNWVDRGQVRMIEQFESP